MAENMGQRLTWSFDVPKSFKHKQEPINGVDGTEVDLVRVYQMVLPYGAPFEETYTVLEEIKAEIQKIEVMAKEQEAQRKKAEAEANAAQEAKDAATAVEEAATN